MKEKISIGVPIYGVRNYIERCAVSLFKQTYANIEYLFVNDCTPDDSIEILESVLKTFPNRKEQVKIISHNQNKGLAAARNTAVANATGSFIIWVDSDDFLEIDAVEKALRKQREGDYDIVSFDTIICKNGYQEYICQPDVTSGKALSLLLLERAAAVSVWGRLIRLSLYKEHSIKVKEGINNGEDYQVTPLLAYYAGSVTSLHERLYHYDFTNESSLSFSFSATKAEQAVASLQILKEFFKGKGEVYMNALQYGEVDLLARLIIDSCFNVRNKSYFISYRNKLNKIDRKYWANISLLKTFGFHLYGRMLMACYFRCMKFLKGGAYQLRSK